MPFDCSQCGECCSHLGLVHIIESEYEPYRFLVKNQYTGERTDVTVDPDKRELFDDRRIFTDRPEACPFFRYDDAVAKGYCTVHLSRPAICRDYGCWRILILDAGGRRAGRVMERRFLASEDERLTRIIQEQIETLPDLDDDAWDREVIRIVTAAGFTTRV